MNDLVLFICLFISGVVLGHNSAQEAIIKECSLHKKYTVGFFIVEKYNCAFDPIENK